MKHIVINEDDNTTSQTKLIWESDVSACDRAIIRLCVGIKRYKYAAVITDC